MKKVLLIVIGLIVLYILVMSAEVINKDYDESISNRPTLREYWFK